MKLALKHAIFVTFFVLIGFNSLSFANYNHIVRTDDKRIEIIAFSKQNLGPENPRLYYHDTQIGGDGIYAVGGTIVSWMLHGEISNCDNFNEEKTFLKVIQSGEILLIESYMCITHWED